MTSRLYLPHIFIFQGTSLLTLNSLLGTFVWYQEKRPPEKRPPEKSPPPGKKPRGKKPPGKSPPPGKKPPGNDFL